MQSRLLIAISLLGACCALSAQSPGQPPATPKFEVASIKPCKTSPTGQLHSSPGRLRLECSSVDNLIRAAYVEYARGPLWQRVPGAALPVLSVSQAEVSMPIKGSTGWISSERFAIDAKAPSPVPEDVMLGPMMQQLLQDRFRLRIHREPAELPVYELTVAKGGAKLQPAKSGACKQLDPAAPPLSRPKGQAVPVPLCGGFGRSASGAGLDVYGVTMRYFCMDLSMSADREVIDKTGLTGEYDLHLDATMEQVGFARRAISPPPGESSTATAVDPGSTLNDAIRKLGLQLRPAKKRVDAIVIDRAERPTAN